MSIAKQAFDDMFGVSEWPAWLRPTTTHPEPETGTSQTALILAHMKSGMGITGLQALDLFGCFRLPARIADIKKLGYEVNREMIEVNGKRVARYWMES
jgi:hypothetical protein